MAGGALRQNKKVFYAGIGVAAILALLIIWAFLASTNQAARSNAEAASVRSDSEKAYENIVKDSLAVYHSRYSTYPASYKELLADITKTPDIYGVSGDGLNELKGINNYLAGFSYGRTGDDVYAVSYQEVNSGETITVTNK